MLDYATIDSILAKLRIVKTGDYVVAGDHNDLVNAAKELRKLLRDLEAQVEAITIALALNDLTDVEAPTPSDKDLLAFEAATEKWKNKPLSIYGLSELGDVEAPVPSNKDLLAFETATSKWKNKPLSMYGLNELGDVEVPSPSDREVLTYESATGKWKNKYGLIEGDYLSYASIMDVTISGTIPIEVKIDAFSRKVYVLETNYGRCYVIDIDTGTYSEIRTSDDVALLETYYILNETDGARIFRRSINGRYIVLGEGKYGFGTYGFILKDGARLLEVDLGARVKAVDISWDGKLAVFACHNGRVVVYEGS